MALNSIPDSEEVKLDFPDNLNTAIEVQGWRMYFDGAVNRFGVGIRVILLTPKGEVVPISKKLAFRVTNNEVEYEACALEMEALIALGVKKVKIFGDSMLVINKRTEEWKLKEQHLRPYLSHLQQLVLSFQKCKFIHLPRNHNQMADALTSLA